MQILYLQVNQAMDNSKKILYLISRSVNRLKYHSINKFTEGGVFVTPSQMGILFLLKNGNSLQMSDLSNALSLDNSTLTRHADKLIKKGFVERVKDDSDRRVSKLCITGPGLLESGKALKIAKQINSDVISGFSEEEISIFIKVLNGIISKFDVKKGEKNE
jgi:DNA-binding MarR family transcriptional regulator